MRSRYTAYFLSLPNYIIKTTHKDNPDYNDDFAQWKNEILEFTQNYTFEKLTILEYTKQAENRFAFVNFKAHISHNNEDHTFTENSRFEKVDNVWFYHSAK